MRAPRPISRSVAAVVSWAPAIFLAVNGCGVRVMPAPQVPEKTVPQLATPVDPPEQDETQIVIDTTNGPAIVQLQLLGMWTHPLCATTPCAANLPHGTYNLIFQGRNDPALQSQDVVQIGRAPTVFRHTMGSARVSQGLYLGGTMILIAGVMIAGFGLLGLGSDGFISKGASYASIGVGAVATGAGGLMMYSGRPELTPSSSVQWAPGGPAPPPGPTGDKQQVLRVTPTGIVVSFK
jgi:hypothetical protein